MRTVYGLAAIGAVAVLSGCARGRVSAPPGPVAANALPAPRLIAPADQSRLTNYPRTVRFQWSAVPEAATYAIEIDCRDCCVKGQWCSQAQGTGYVVPNLKEARYTFDFWGDQAGRWRVWAVDSRARPGLKSAWASFSFQTGPADSKPSPFGAPGRR